jgi:Arc/MetJ family transcription regulator
MSAAPKLKRKSYFVDEAVLKKAKRVLGVSTEAEVVRLAVERTVEMDRFWRLLADNKGKVPRGSFRRP